MSEAGAQFWMRVARGAVLLGIVCRLGTFPGFGLGSSPAAGQLLPDRL